MIVATAGHVDHGKTSLIRALTGVDTDRLAEEKRRGMSIDLGFAQESFAFYGPTCDDADYMEGPFLLPADIAAGDYIEIGMLGAYGAAMRTKFNGFGQGDTFEVADEPMNSLYTGTRKVAVKDNVVSLR